MLLPSEANFSAESAPRPLFNDNISSRLTQSSVVFELMLGVLPRAAGNQHITAEQRVWHREQW
jgi:hypothetical protein